MTDGPQEGRKSQVIVLQSSSRYHVGEDVDTERQEYDTQELNAGRKGVVEGAKTEDRCMMYTETVRSQS